MKSLKNLKKILARMKFHNLNEDKLLEIKAEKVKKRGAFKKRIILEKVWEE